MTEIDDTIIALVKGMLLRGDRQSDISGCFRINSGRIAEIHNSMTRSHQNDEASLTTRARSVNPAPKSDLPPADYPSPYELWRASRAVWAARVALGHTKEKIEVALKALEAAEIKS